MGLSVPLPMALWLLVDSEGLRPFLTPADLTGALAWGVETPRFLVAGEAVTVLAVHFLSWHPGPLQRLPPRRCTDSGGHQGPG